MPELPEVESVRRGLRQWVTGSRARAVRVLDERILGTTSQRVVPAGAASAFAHRLTGVSFAEVERRGKFMWLPLVEGEVALGVHLGMSGQFRVHHTGDAVHPHTRAVFELAPSLHGAGNAAESTEPIELRFVDQRIFGHLGVEPLVSGRAHWGSAERRLVGASAADIAPDPFEAGFDAAATARVMKLRKSPIKAVLLDQSVISGIGNIYADEALFAAGVHPAAQASRLRISRIEAVIEAARQVMTRALDAGGTSFDALYVGVNGESGYFERSLQVYGRAGQECPRCGTLIRRTTVAGRSTRFCPKCQPVQRRSRVPQARRQQP